MANYPGSLPSFTNPQATDFLNSPAHATQHSSNNDETVAIATKIGTGASTPTTGTVLAGTGTGTSAWQALTSKFGFYVAGALSVANDLSWNPTVPTAQTVTTLYAYVRTAPTGADMHIQIYNVTQANVVATLTITAGSNTATTTSMTNASLTAADVLRFDCTQIGSTVAGSDVSAILF